MDILDEAARRGRRASSSAVLNDSYTDDEREFMCAVDDYKRKHGRPFPTCSEVLAVLVSLGYRKD